MKKITMIITCEITTTEVVEDDDVVMLDDSDKAVSDLIKDLCGADDVQILKKSILHS